MYVTKHYGWTSSCQVQAHIHAAQLEYFQPGRMHQTYDKEDLLGTILSCRLNNLVARFRLLGLVGVGIHRCSVGCNAFLALQRNQTADDRLRTGGIERGGRTGIDKVSLKREAFGILGVKQHENVSVGASAIGDLSHDAVKRAVIGLDVAWATSIFTLSRTPSGEDAGWSLTSTPSSTTVTVNGSNCPMVLRRC